MKEGNDKRVRELVRRAIPPVSDTELQRDLWPQMLRRLDERPAQVLWFDWALAALVGIWLCFSPELIPVLLYHL